MVLMGKEKKEEEEEVKKTNNGRLTTMPTGTENISQFIKER